MRFVPALIIAASSWLASGCISHRWTLSYEDLPHHNGNAVPIIKATLNGVSGYFVIDTGAAGPLLSTAAAARCGIRPLTNEVWAIGFNGGRTLLTMATNITVGLGQDVYVQWPSVPLTTGGPYGITDSNYVLFGVLDYHTLQKLGVVIDTRQKTITITK